MGLLTEGTPLSYERIHAIAGKLRRRGVRQFVRHFRWAAQLRGDADLWGDEIEYTLVHFGADGSVKCLLAATRVLEKIKERGDALSAEWQPEYAAFMLEGVPNRPYNGLKECVWRVEAEMRTRRRELEALLGDGQRLMSLACFPLLGTDDFCHPSVEKADGRSALSMSTLFPDQAINLDFAHFPTVTKVITERRGRPVHAHVPVFVDRHTPRPFVDRLDGREVDDELVKEDHVLLDGMPFGPCCCSLQTTFGCDDLKSMLWLRDQLIPFAPIALALTAATPILRGYLCDTDCRWDVLKQCLDDRTTSERQGNRSYAGVGRVTTSRCESVDSYCTGGLEPYNDVALPFDRHAYDQMLAGDVPAGFAQALAHLFIREPLQVFEESLEHLDDDVESMEMFEDIHLFHWRTVRTKLPPLDGSSGWKVEFRPMEAQPTDFQNAAFAVFAFLVAKTIQAGGLRMEMPISLVFDNMSRACRRDAVRSERFWWPATVDGLCRRPVRPDAPEADVRETTVDGIINGDGGVLACVRRWLDTRVSASEISASEREALERYLKLVADRAKGTVPTPARWQREFVRAHAGYGGDSLVRPSVLRDMLLRLERIDHRDDDDGAHTPD